MPIFVNANNIANNSYNYDDYNKNDTNSEQGQSLREGGSGGVWKPRFNKFQRVMIKIQYKLFSVIAFLKLRRCNLSISNLSVSNCSLSPISALMISQALMDFTCPLTILDISQNEYLFNPQLNPFQDGKGNKMSLKFNRKLFYESTYRPIWLPESSHGDKHEGGEHMMIDDLETIRHGNVISCLFNILNRNHSIRHIKLNHSGIRNEMMKIVSDGLRLSHSKSLQSVDLSDNNIGVKGLSWLSNTLHSFGDSLTQVGMKNGMKTEMKNDYPFFIDQLSLNSHGLQPLASHGGLPYLKMPLPMHGKAFQGSEIDVDSDFDSDEGTGTHGTTSARSSINYYYDDDDDDEGDYDGLEVE
jgi:hypothetical protein